MADLESAAVPIEPPTRFVLAFGADSGTRTRDLHFGKVAFYQLNYVRLFMAWEGPKGVAWVDLQSLRTAIFSCPNQCYFVAGARVELATFRLSVERSNQMSYPAITGSYLYWRLPSHLATTPELGLGWIRTNDGCLFKRCVLY